MILKLFRFISLIMVLIFFVFILNYYFSEKNIELIKINRNLNGLNIKKTPPDLPILKNNTNNVIEFNSGYESTYDKKYKRTLESN